MKKRVYIRQPVYLPGLVFFDQLLQVDTYIIYDNVQYERRHFGNRNKIRTYQGDTWLTVPVIQKNKRSQRYSDTVTANILWAKDHWKTIYFNYVKAPYFKEYADFFENLYQNPPKNLLDIDLKIIKYLIKQFDIDTRILLASEVSISNNFESKTERLAHIVISIGGGTYVTSKGTKNYIDERVMDTHGIKLLWHEFSHPIYQQFHGGFIPNMSAIDLLFNYGEKSKDVLRSNLKKPLVTF